MPARNTATSYGSVAKSLHWLTALLILTAIPLGIIANGAPFETGEELARKAWLFSMHKTVGVSVFFVALARIAWAISQPKPAGLHPERKAESFLAEMVHWLLYGSLLLVPLSGWIHHAATSGFAPILWPFGQNLPLIPKNETLAALSAGLHLVFERVLLISIGLHVIGALKHHFFDKDATLRRMLPGQTNAGARQDTRSVLPASAALVIWAAAMGVGAILGLYTPHAEQTPSAAKLEEVQSEWQVQDGRLEITTTQFGGEVSGGFSDWTAEITFEPRDGPGSHGTVRVVISINSLSLGSVTGQALGPDFFDAATHQTAEFTAELIHQADGYTAEGRLRLRGAEMPVVMPFTLNVENDVAHVTGQLTLDRRDFGIGDNLPDESSLAFAVKVNVALTASRTAE